MTLNEKVQEAKTMWTAIVPYCSLPTENTLIRWVARFSTDELMAGFSITGGKFDAERTATPERVHRYCTSVMHNRQIETRAQRAGAAQ
jgi:hypothetical protein